MYQKSFPKCEIKGDQSPSPKRHHMLSSFAVPNKCMDCEFSFEGECIRGMELTGGYLRYDYGNCGIEGKTEAMAIKVLNTGMEIFVPNKCVNCKFLTNDKLRGYVCSKDKNLWGDTFRDFDWGDWKPKYPNIGLSKTSYDEEIRNYLGHVAITEEVIDYILDGQKTKALKIYRELNKISTIKEAKKDIDEIEKKLKKALNNA